MLHLLAQYARSHGRVEPGFAPKQVRWAIRLAADGRFLDVVELGDTGSRKNAGRTFAACPDLTQPELIRAGKGARHFLVDGVDVVALHQKDENGKWFTETEHLGPMLGVCKLVTGDLPTVAATLAAKHAFFVALLRQAATAVPKLSLSADAISDSTTLKEIGQRLTMLKAKPTDRATFQIGGLFPADGGEWHDWWKMYRREMTEKATATGKHTTQTGEMICFIAGTACQPAATHPKISGLSDVGGLAAGDALVSFDKEAFGSYRLEQGANAAISEAEAQAYRLGLNSLLKDHSTRLIGAKVVHWYKDRVPPEDDPLPWIHDIGDDTVEAVAQARARKLLDAIRSGQRPDLQSNRYFALTLSGAAGRVMVRDWMEGQFDALVSNVLAWFEDLAIVRRDGQGLTLSPKFFAVVGALGRELDEVPSPMVGQLWRAAVTKSVISPHVLARALARFRASMFDDEPFNHARMGLMRAYHVRKGDAMVQPALNEQHPSLAYHCGRLMAQLARIQYAALGDVGAGVVQRYYAAASTTPALILGRLSRTAQFHLGKLDTGLARWFELRLAEIWSRLKDGPPAVLRLEEQSLFALGYYQQIAADRAERSEKAKEDSTEVHND